MRLERYQVEGTPVGRRERMLAGLALVLSIALMAAGCAGPIGSLRAGPGPQVAVAAAPSLAPSSRPDLDNLMYAGGGSAPVPTVVAAPIAAVAPAAEAGSVYQLDSGDRLRIVVFGQEGLSNSYIVDAAGNITMPLIGAVPARGTSTSELARVVGAHLRNGFIREPHVAIEIESYRPFFILGEVTYPGQYPYVPNMTVETAVAIAGGFTPRAYRWDVKVARNQGGQAYRTSVPLTYALRPGDTITIDERWF
jgi:polysaccharide export outer membrane protein